MLFIYLTQTVFSELHSQLWWGSTEAWLLLSSMAKSFSKYWELYFSLAHICETETEFLSHPQFIAHSIKLKWNFLFVFHNRHCHKASSWKLRASEFIRYHIIYTLYNLIAMHLQKSTAQNYYFSHYSLLLFFFFSSLKYKVLYCIAITSTCSWDRLKISYVCEDEKSFFVFKKNEQNHILISTTL